MKQTDFPKSAPMAESKIPQEDKAGAMREHQQGKGVRGEQGMVQEGSTAASAQVLGTCYFMEPGETCVCPYLLHASWAF